MDNCLKFFKGKLLVLAIGIFSYSLALAEEGVMVLPDGSAEVVTNTSSNSSSGSGASIASGLPFPAIMTASGGLVNSPGTGAGGADESILQNLSLGMNTLGFGHQGGTPIRIADDFTLTTNVLLNSITFYAYQTGSSTTSTITSLNLRIWDGPPAAPGSNIVFGDTTTNILTSSTWSNIYRSAESTPGSTIRPIMTNVANIGTELPAGSYWLDWQTGGSTSFSGPWAPPITINGQTTTGNGLQSVDNGVTFPAANDIVGTPQGFPFILDFECTDNDFSCIITTIKNNQTPFCDLITETESGYLIATPFGTIVDTSEAGQVSDIDGLIREKCFPPL